MVTSTSDLSPPAADRDKQDSDDDSVATAVTGSKIIKNQGETKEYVVKFLFRPKKNGSNTEVARTHYSILDTIINTYPTGVTIFDNYGQRLRDFSTIKSYDSYLRHFQLQYAKPTIIKNRGTIYISHHRFHSSINISEIHRHHVVSALLQQVNTRMTVHQWNKDEVHISTLGFFVGVDPANHLPEDYIASVRKFIATQVGKREKKIPPFRLAYSSPFLLNSDGTRASTKLYDLQVRQKDAKEMIRLLQTAYQSKPTFIFHKLRHQDMVSYRNAIQQQNAFLRDSRAVPIHGISSDHMFSFDILLRQIPGVTEVLRHKHTDTIGRWNVLTKVNQFKEVTAAVENLIQQHSTKLTSDQFPTPGLVFTSRMVDSVSSDQSFATYLSACYSMYAAQDTDDTFDQPPVSSIPMAQAWGGPTVPSTILEPTVTTPISGISQDVYDQVIRDNDSLRAELTAQ
jgi:hypothetical protein